MMNPGDERNAKSDLTNTVSIAASACHPVETAGGDTVVTPVNRPLTVKGSSKQRNRNARSKPGRDTSTSGKRDTSVTKNCENCGQEYVTKRPTLARYCSGACRQEAWAKNNPEKAAALNERKKAAYRAWLEERGIAWEERS